MEQALDRKVNQLPVRTWNRLRMNESSLPIPSKFLKSQNFLNSNHKNANKLPVFGGQAERILQQEEKGQKRWDIEKISSISTGMGAELDDLVRTFGGSPLRFLAEQGKQGLAANLHYSLETGMNGNYIQAIEILAEENSSLTIIMDFTSEHAAEGFAAIQTKILAKQGAKLRIVQLQLLGEPFTFCSDIGGICEENATIEILQLFLGAGKTYAGCQVELLGKDSQMNAQVGYFGRNKQHFDMNYVAVHRGAKSNSEMNLYGILQDEAFKLFRGTIDFQAGASKAKGTEKEDVLLLSEGTINQTIPLILCGEEDVSGSHGATIGKLEEELLFYLCSRGLTKEDACQLITRAKLDALCRKIGDQEEEALVQGYLEEVIGNGG